MSDNDLPRPESWPPEHSDLAPDQSETVQVDLGLKVEEFDDEGTDLGPGWVPV